MNSAGSRGFTVVTVVTLIFAPVFSHQQWLWRLVGRTSETHVEQCAANEPCPKQKHVQSIVKLGEPQDAHGR
jgi:hypothetical protein